MMNKESLKNRILTEFQAQGWEVTSDNTKLATALANAIIDEIQQNARAVGVDSHNDTHELTVE